MVAGIWPGPPALANLEEESGMRVIRRRNVLGVAVVAAVALAAACGSSSNGDGSSPASAEEFVVEVDNVCREADAELDMIEDPQSEEDFLPALQAALPIQEMQAEDLRAIEPPDELAPQYNEALGLIDAQVAVIQQTIDDLEAGQDPNTVVVEFNDALDQNDERLDQIAEDLGLTQCGTGSDGDSGTTTDDTTTDATTGDTLTDDTTTDATPTTGQTGDVQQYLTDVGAASQALISFGEILQNVSSPSDLENSADEAQAQLDEFDTAIAQLDGYTLDDADLEEQRSDIVAAAPDVSDSLRRFVDAAAAGDLSAVQSLLPEVTSALTNFQQAASGNP